MSDSIPHGFRQIPGYPRYAINENGDVISVKRMKPATDKYGYLRVYLSHDGREQHAAVHKLVLLAFVGSCPTGMQCRHLDGNPKNNHVSNLAWGTRSENQRDRVLHGTDDQGERNYGAKLTNADVLTIRERAASGERQVDIAKDFPVSPTNISSIIHRKTWKHV